MNPYLKNLNKIEFVVTDACTGRCKHCSQGKHSSQSTCLASHVAADAVRKITAAYHIQTVMTFGGEPLLHPEAVYAVMQAATERNVPKRQVITNGYFSKDTAQIRGVAERLAACGVNDLLLSVDAFHQETIPLGTVKLFAAQARDCGIPIRLSPAWLVSATADNPYNCQTREILNSFSEMQIPTGEGNVVFPEGNALQYFAAYFEESKPDNPYKEDPYDVRCISFSSNGDVLNHNVYRCDIMEIIESYTP